MTPTNPALDVLLVGGGLANGLLAYRLRQLRPDLRMRVLERDACLGGVHTWSFHTTDLNAAQNEWVAPLVVHHWSGYEVRFPEFSRRLRIGYNTVTAERFRDVITAALGSALWTGVDVVETGPGHVRLADGEIIEAKSVIDGRGYRNNPGQVDRFQGFFGQEVRLAAPHGLHNPVLMDATVDQLDGFRFIYLLPVAPALLLIEDTSYTETATLDVAALRRQIAAYATGMGWTIMDILREEQGVLPITLSGHLDHEKTGGATLPAVGMRAGLYHPTTGYALPDAVRLADRIAALPDLTHAALASLTWGHAGRVWQRRALFRLLNRLLFLAGPATDRYKIMRRFYTMPEALIARFYAADLLPHDTVRLLVGRPPVPVSGALRAIMATGR